jgi:hypothetical protein
VVYVFVRRFSNLAPSVWSEKNLPSIHVHPRHSPTGLPGTTAQNLWAFVSAPSSKIFDGGKLFLSKFQEIKQVSRGCHSA